MLISTPQFYWSPNQERARATSTAEGHADCLGDLLAFHEDLTLSEQASTFFFQRLISREDNGLLAASYWRTQCVKRDDSIRRTGNSIQNHVNQQFRQRASKRRRPFVTVLLAARFLSLKLQEYTVPSAEYHKRRAASFSGLADQRRTAKLSSC